MLYPWLQESFHTFATACGQGRLPGSVILAGHSDLGTLDLALECARFYLCEHKEQGVACGTCRSCKSFVAGAHADFIVVRPTLKDEADAGLDVLTNPLPLLQEAANIEDNGAQRRSVRIDSIRKLIEWLNLSHVGGQGKVAIVHEAHTMPVGAANSILKSFEEPPPHTLIILTAKSLESLLPTIISRAFKLKVTVPTLTQAQEFLQPYGFADSKIAIALALSQQAPLGALRLLQQGVIDKTQEILTLLPPALNGGSDVAVVEKLAALGPALEVTILGELTRELLKYKAGLSVTQLPLLNPQSAAALCRLPAEHLFTALSDLQHFALQAPFIPPRAPLALLRAWVRALANAPRTR